MHPAKANESCDFHAAKIDGIEALKLNRIPLSILFW